MRGEQKATKDTTALKEKDYFTFSCIGLPILSTAKHQLTFDIFTATQSFLLKTF